MKHLRYFEDSSLRREYWLVDSKYLEIAIEKLNLSNSQKRYLLNNRYLTCDDMYYNAQGDHYYIKSFYLPVVDGENQYDVAWVPANDPNQNLKNFFAKQEGLEYKGKLRITKKDIKEWKLKKNSQKYNL